MSQQIEFFDGQERVEAGAPFGRSTRKGSFKELAVSDAERVRKALKARDFARAGSYLEILHPNGMMMLEVFYEWCLALRSTVGELLGDKTKAAGLVDKAFERWVKVTEKSFKADAQSSLKELLSPARQATRPVEVFRQEKAGNPMALTQGLSDVFMQVFGALQEAMMQGDGEKAVEAFDRYLEYLRSRHDLMVEYVAAFGAVVSGDCGESFADQAIEKSYQSIPIVSRLWDLLSKLGPSELALFLAEHMRAHLSGPARDGQVEIIEESDRYRIVFGPCGSGGALRRRHSPENLALIKTPCPSSWNRAGQVPAFCAHCAHNEKSLIARFGYPMWVTEFNPDPNQPCGWTVYKDRSAIPEGYFTRLGFKK